MSIARPHAHIYEKWVKGIRQAVPNDGERCGLYEYIIAYQFARVYGTAELPNKHSLSQTAAIALAMLEGDLYELCEARIDSNGKRRENGAKNTPSRTEQVQAGAGRTLQNNTIQNNTIQNKDNNKSKPIIDALAGTVGCGLFDIFECGLLLLRRGYYVYSNELRSVANNAQGKHDPKAYVLAAAEKGAFVRAKDAAALTVAANYVESTGIKELEALEVYAARTAGSVLEIVCSNRAGEILNSNAEQQAGTNKYLQQIHASGVRFTCVGKDQKPYSRIQGLANTPFYLS